MINLTQFFEDLGITSINSDAIDQYEFYKGVEWDDGTTTNDQYEFYKKLMSNGGYRYEFFKTYVSEYEFYTGGFNDSRILDFYTFYKYAAGDFTSTIVTDGLYVHLDAGLTSSYSGSGTNWLDIGSKGLTVSLTGSPTYVSTGPSYFTFNGTDQTAVSTTNIGISGSQSRTVGVWYRCTGTNSSGNYQQTILRFGDNVNYQDNVLYQWNTGNGQWLYNGQGWSVFESSTPTLGNWEYYVVSYGGTATAKIYRNGVDITGSGTGGYGSQVLNTLDSTLDLAFLNESGGIRYLKGDISQVQIYNRQLTDSEVLRNYNADLTRYNDFDPSTLNGLTVWLDGDDADTITRDGNDYVSEWSDKSGNSYGLTSSSGIEPIYQDGGIYFNGATSSLSRYAASPGIDHRPSTVFCVYKLDAIQTQTVPVVWRMGVANTSVATRNTYGIYTESGNTKLQGRDSGNGIEVINRSVTYDMRVDVGTWDGSDNLTYYSNGSMIGTLATATLDVDTFYTLKLGQIDGFSTSFMKGYIYEFIWYNRVLTESERNQVTTYLTNKWSI